MAVGIKQDTARTEVAMAVMAEVTARTEVAMAVTEEDTAVKEEGTVGISNTSFLVS